MKFQICKIGPPLDFSETLDIFKIPNRKSSETGFCIILGDHYLNYKNALRYLQCETLKDRRKKLCLTFAKKSLKHPKYQNWFVPNTPKVKPITRSEKTSFKPVTTRTDRYFFSPLPHLTRLLNLEK